MVGLSRRFLGCGLLGAASLLVTQPLALWTVVDASVLPTLAEPASYLALVPPALVAASAVLMVAGVAALRNRTVGTRDSLATPVVSVLAGFGLLVVAGTDPAALSDAIVSTVTLSADDLATEGLPAAGTFLLAGAAVGGSVAPVLLGALKGDTYALLGGFVLVLSGISLSPAPPFAAVAGLLGGLAAVGVLWSVDVDGWRP